MGDHVVGLDIGSTYVKAVLLTGDGEQLAEMRRRTPWRSLPGGRTEMAAAALVAEVEQLFADLAAAHPTVHVAAIGITGMAEAGALIDRDGEVVAPVVAWFDPRGADEVERLDPAFRHEFTGRTGLPSSELATFAKLLHAQASGVSLAGCQWLNLPEYVAHVLGGGRFGELSLMVRTGLIDQDTAQPWSVPLELLGAGSDLLPPIHPAGSVWGTATTLVPGTFAGAVLTVAGHDHLVASVAAGCLEPADLYDSMGTAEALVRVLADPLDAPTRARLAVCNINVGRHLLPGRSVIVAGIKTGLLLRRVLQLVGVADETGRARLDDLVMALPAGAPVAQALHVSGSDNSDGVLAVRADGDGLSPELFFAATLEHSGATLAGVLELMEREVGPAEHTVLSGGWASMRSVQRSRAEVLPNMQVSTLSEGTAYGAALIAAFAALDPAPDRDLVNFARNFGAKAFGAQGLDAADREPVRGLQTSTRGRTA